MLGAYRQLHEIEKRQAAIAELPIASLQALTANINRDPKKGKDFTPIDFCLFRGEDAEKKELFRPEVAAVALDLQSLQQLPRIVLVAWNEILASAKNDTTMPEVRALRSDDERVVVLAPIWEGQHIRAGLVAVHGVINGPVRLRDIDRPLASYVVMVPERKAAAWLEGDLLLAAAET